jgi:energy-coupling factor transport system ATP-binding protein
MALIAQALTFAYPPRAFASGGEHAVIEGFSAVFEPGRITALTGPNGSGKTTLAKLLVGILKPASGAVTLDGDAIADRTLTEIGRRVGFVMQDPSRQIFKTSVYDEMTFGLSHLGLAEDAMRARADEYLALFDLADKRDDFPFDLSTGERQRLVLAAILAMKPSYLVLDEPTVALDPGRRRRLGGYLREIASRNDVGVVLISHDARFVSTLADMEITLNETEARDA